MPPWVQVATGILGALGTFYGVIASGRAKRIELRLAEREQKHKEDEDHWRDAAQIREEQRKDREELRKELAEAREDSKRREARECELIAEMDGLRSEMVSLRDQIRSMLPYLCLKAPDCPQRVVPQN